MAAKSGKTLTVTVKSNHPSSSSNSPRLALPRSLSRCVHLSCPPISASFSTWQGSICPICVFWLCVTMHACAFCGCGLVMLYIVRVLWSSRGCRQSGRFGQGFGTFTSICNETTEKQTRFDTQTHTQFTHPPSYIDNDVCEIINWIVQNLSPQTPSKQINWWVFVSHTVGHNVLAVVPEYFPLQIFLH